MICRKMAILKPRVKQGGLCPPRSAATDFMEKQSPPPALASQPSSFDRLRGLGDPHSPIHLAMKPAEDRAAAMRNNFHVTCANRSFFAVVLLIFNRLRENTLRVRARSKAPRCVVITHPLRTCDAGRLL